MALVLLLLPLLLFHQSQVISRAVPSSSRVTRHANRGDRASVQSRGLSDIVCAQYRLLLRQEQERQELPIVWTCNLHPSRLHAQQKQQQHHHYQYHHRQYHQGIWNRRLKLQLQLRPHTRRHVLLQLQQQNARLPLSRTRLLR